MNSLKPMEEIRQGNLLALPINPNFDAWVAAWKTACTGLECGGVRPGLWNQNHHTGGDHLHPGRRA
jgi:glucose/mannose transport system permease protein